MVIVWGGIGVSYREIVGWSLVKRLSHRHSLCLFAQNTQGKHAAMRVSTWMSLRQLAGYPDCGTSYSAMHFHL